MEVLHNAQVYMWPTHSLFPYRVQPQYRAAWYPWEFGDGPLTNGEGGTTNVAHNYEGQHTTSTPLRVPHNAFLQAGIDALYDTELALVTAAGGYDSTLPSVTWTSNAETGCFYQPLWGSQTSRSMGISVMTSTYTSANTNKFELTSTVSNHQALTVTVSARPQPKVFFAAGTQGGVSTASDTPQVWVGVKQGAVYWKVISESNGDYLIQQSTDSGATWITLQQIPRTSSASPQLAGFDYGNGEPLLDVEFKLLSERMYIRLNDRATVFSFIAKQETKYLVGMFGGASNFLSANMWGEPGKWDNTMSIATPYHSAPYSAMTYDSLSMDNAPDSGAGWTETLDTSTVDPGTGQPYTQTTGPNLRAKVDFTGPTDGTYKGNAYSDLTKVIRGFYTDSTPNDYSDPQPATQLFPERIVVNHKFDPEALTIHSYAKLFFNNYDGSWGNWMLNTGQVAVQVYASRTTDDGSMSSPQLIFTGYGHCEGDVESVEGGSLFVMTCCDRMIQLDSPRWDLPRMDAWNQFYAASYLAQLGGFVPDDLYFNALVGPDPDTDLGDQYGNPAPFLGIGDAGSLQNRYANGKLDELLIKQANPIGYMVFTDVAGKLHFEKFQLADGIKRVFFDSDWESVLGTGLNFNSVLASSVRKNMREVRSDFAIIGINSYTPYWNPIIERRPVDPSTNPIIFDPTAYNHLGYQNMGQWVDGIFADSTFASNAADYMYRVFSLPGLDVSLPTAWLQPDIFPLDNVCYTGDRVPLSSIPLMVTEITHDITIQRATTDITARYVPGSPPIA